MSRIASPVCLVPPGRILAIFPLTLALSACVTREFTPPKPDLADAFSAGNLARTAEGPWWGSFRDPTLDGLITQGLERNLTIREAVAAIDEARAAAHIVKAQDLPNVQASAAAARGDAQGVGSITEQSSAGLSASWALDLFGGNRAAREAAIAELEAAELSHTAAQHAISAEIAAAYIDLRFYQESIALTRQSIRSRQETLELSRSMQELGQSGRLDVLQAEQAIIQAEASLPSLQIGFDQSLNRLATLLNSRSAELLPGLKRGAAQPSARKKPSVGVPAEVIRARPDVQIAERQLAAAAARVGVAEAAFWPSVSLSGTIAPTNLRGGGSPTPWSIGPRIDLPLFTGGANKAALSVAESRAAQEEIRWRSTVLDAIEEVENALTAWSRGGANVAAQRRLVAAAEETVLLARESWQSGQADFFTVLDAERVVLAARSALAGAVRDQANAYVGLSLAAAQLIN